MVRKTSKVDKNTVLDSTENHVALNVDKDLPPIFVQREHINRNSSNDLDETLANMATEAASTNVDSERKVRHAVGGHKIDSDHF